MAYINKNEFFYDLPEELIAQTPAVNRESSRLMTLNKESGMITHGVFSDILEYIMPGDCLVINNTKVIPARLRGQIKGASIGSSEMELLLVCPTLNGLWEVMAKPGKKARIGTNIIFGGGTLIGEIVEIKEDGNRLVLFTHGSEYPSFRAALDELGEMPLPPYIKTKPSDTNRYQTVYAKHEGSVAAPTAGLHFTPELLEALRNKGVRVASITLHVGPGTFRPVKTDDITQHKMHPEFYDIDESQAEIINSTRRNGGRIIAVGTTSSRTLEACADENGFIKKCSGSTDIFIYPGYAFKAVDGLITNFHLPESTLIMLVSALCGTENTLNAYKEAVSKRYRFFSFGDAMFIY